jgi:ubiquinone/menaquinone biosynthesis C-methylase UbiE
MDDYWHKYFSNPNIVNNHNSQLNVGRTKNGIPIPRETWEKTLRYIKKQIGVQKGLSDVLELCCGNGQIIGNLSLDCASAIGIDYSKPLLDQLKKSFPEVKTIHNDILNVHFYKEQFHSIIFYFSIQHFDERDALIILQRAVTWLKPKGKILIGDIPNELKKWEYINKPEYQKDYMIRLIDKRPMIGYWFNPHFFQAISTIIPDISVTCMEQPKYQINASYRFDVIIEKY